MSRLIPIIAIALLSLVLVWLVSYWKPTAIPLGEHQRLALAGPPAGGDFHLTAADGPFSLSGLQGKVVLLYFGYTACPDICPTNLAIIALALRALKPSELEQVNVVFVSVDPERDTPERIADYVRFFHPRVIGVTGSAGEVTEAAAKYGAAYQRSDQPDSAMGYMVDHSAYTYVVDGSGELAEVLDHATPAEDIVATIRRLLEHADG
jgi:protein SCO1/2